jgi:hypothetical protein
MYHIYPETTRGSIPPLKAIWIRPLAKSPLLSTIEEESPKAPEIVQSYRELAAEFA